MAFSVISAAPVCNLLARQLLNHREVVVATQPVVCARAPGEQLAPQLLVAASINVSNSCSWLTHEVPLLLTPACLQGHYSCCCADTWASEIGMLSSSAPRLITTGRRVPTGTNGGVTLLGLAASAAGGLFMGLVVWAAGCVSRETRHPGVLQQHNSMHAQQWMLLATAAGVFGSLTDSLLGATVQYSGWCTKTHKVVPRAAQHVQHISGLPLLSNNAVNAVSALLTSLGVAVVVLLHARGAGVLS